MRAILKASAVMGVSSVVTIALSIVRQKFIAVMLGPEGIGLLGLLASGLGVASTLFSLGLASSGVRYVANAQEQDEEKLSRTCSSLIYASQILGISGGLLFIIFRLPLANILLHDATKSPWMIWLGFALWASIVSGGQLAVINGLRRIGDLARANVWGAALGTVATLIAVSVSGEVGLVAAIVATPLSTWLASWWLARDVRLLPLKSHVAELWATFGGMVKLGLVFAAGLVLTNITRLLARLLIERTLGLEATGHFQAAWGIATVYLGFVTGALAAEYYPRLSAVATRGDDSVLNQEVTNQLQLMLLLAGPIILGLILAAPLAIRVLYSGTFQDAISVLRWQLIGDVFKISGWAVGFLLLAREARAKFFTAELLWNGLYILALALFLPRYGLVTTGIAYAACYLAYLIFVLWCAYTETKFKLASGDRKALIYFSAAGLLVRVAVEFGTAGLWASTVLVLISTVVSVRKLKQLTQVNFKSILNYERFRS